MSFRQNTGLVSQIKGDHGFSSKNEIVGSREVNRKRGFYITMTKEM